MFDELKFREICSEFYHTKVRFDEKCELQSEFLSILLGKVTESFGNQGIIETT